MDDVTFGCNGRDARKGRNAALSDTHHRRGDTGAESDVYECFLNLKLFV